MSRTITVADVTFNEATGKLTNHAGNEVTVDGIKPRKLLHFLMSNLGTSHSARQLLEHLYAGEQEAKKGIIRVYISQIRRKLVIVTAKLKINTQYKKGYRMVDLTPP